MRTSTFVILLVIIVLLAGAAYYFLTSANNPNPATLYGSAGTPETPNTGGTPAAGNTTSNDGGGTASGTNATPTTSVAAVSIATSSELGSYLIGSNGMTLYTYASDTPNTTNCTGPCAATWPPYTVLSTAPPTGGKGVKGNLGTIMRPDNGETQITYNGSPLYFFADDTNPGDAKGMNIQSWNLGRP